MSIPIKTIPIARINGPSNETGNILVKAVNKPKIFQKTNKGLKFVQIERPNNEVRAYCRCKHPSFITSPGKSQLKILEILFNR